MYIYLADWDTLNQKMIFGGRYGDDQGDSYLAFVGGGAVYHSKDPSRQNLLLQPTPRLCAPLPNWQRSAVL